jgi:hypothetical protein
MMLLLSYAASEIRGNMGQCKSEGKTLREIKENMQQCKSKERDFKK